MTVDAPPAVSLQLEIISTLEELRQQIGNLQAQSTHIAKSLETADERRREMYAKLNKIDAIEREMQRITPLVETHEQKHQRSIGALWLVRGGWTVGGGAVGAAIIKLVSYLSGGGLPPQH